MQNDCVTETKVTLFRSNTSTSLAKSVSERDEPVDLVDRPRMSTLPASTSASRRCNAGRSSVAPLYAAIVVSVVEREPAFMALARRCRPRRPRAGRRGC